MNEKISHSKGPNTSRFFQVMLVNSKSATILVMDTEGMILDSSLGVEEYFGYSKRDLVGKNFSELFIPEDRSKQLPEEELKTVIARGTSKDNNFILHKDGSFVWASGESILSEDDRGNKYIVKIILDLNHQKLLEKELLTINEKLLMAENNLTKKVEALNKLNTELNTFVYSASHDLKGPINNIEALADSLPPDLSEKSRSQVHDRIIMLKTSIEKFKVALNDLASVARAQEEGYEEYTLTNLQELVDEVKILLKDEIESTKALITTDFSKLPSVYFSKRNLRSILLNLMSNALRYRSPERPPEICISTRLEGDDWIHLKVADNGLGIKEEDKGKIFEMYNRLHKNIEGTGVGLSIVKRIVDNHHGIIKVESEVGKGSVFNVFFKNL